jgi:hypothetical protein
MSPLLKAKGLAGHVMNGQAAAGIKRRAGRQAWSN